VTEEADAADVRWMARAMELATLARGATRPNPMVGAVLVSRDTVVGEGFHQKAGEAHAEINALRAAGDAAKGATAYVTLEPCCHHGRTGPCTEALLEAGVSRVVVGSIDPNPQVAGQGVERLREAGVEVLTGVLEDACWEMNSVFNHWVTTGRPLVVLKLATTLDGRIAAAGGASQWITGALARERVHAMRAELAGIMVGSGTALADDPRLTARDVETPTGQPTRILVDGRLRVPTSSKLFASDAEVLVATAATDEAALGERRDAGAMVLGLATDSGRVDLEALLDHLGGRQPDPVTGLLVEGGGGLSTALLRRDLVDRLHLFVAPTFMGGDGLAAIGALGVRHPDEAPRFDVMRVNTLGDDLEIVLHRRP